MIIYFRRKLIRKAQNSIKDFNYMESSNKSDDFSTFDFDHSRLYKTKTFYLTGSKWSEISERSHVCLATQTSFERLYELFEIVHRWSGPISVAIFAPDIEFQMVKTYLQYFSQCESSRIQQVITFCLLVLFIFIFKFR